VDFALYMSPLTCIFGDQIMIEWHLEFKSPE